ncbi:MAG: ATP-dependent DNA helicase RecG [bacterium]
MTGVELTAGLTQKLAELAEYGLEGVHDRIVRGAFRMFRADLDDLRDPLSEAVCKKHRLLLASEAYEAIHGASSQRRAGWKRLAFEEGVYAQLGLALGETANKTATRGVAHPVLHSLATRLTTWRDVQVDDDHLIAFEVIKRDLRASRPMLRVLAGRPGDDRDRVALLTAVTVAESKAQVLWLMPNPVMAEALFTLFEPMLRELGLVSRLLGDEPSRPVRDALRRGEVHIVFGTLELAKADLQMRRLGLVIAQESVPGETERSALVSEGTASPDILIVPTRAIGAGHLLGPYAEHAISWVKPARWPRFHTMLVPASKRDAAYEEVLKSIQAGAQALIALPMGKSGDLLEPEEAVRVRITLETHLPGARIQLFHGALSREERNRRYEDFQRRRFEVLLATHAVEFGADTPGATELIVEQADRMPRERLSRLMHRLVHIEKPTVRLIHGDDPNPAGMEVLRKLKRGRIDDALAPEPFETSEPKLLWLEPSRDVDLLLAARTVALDILVKDPTLQRANVSDIARALALWWPGLFDGECPVTVGKSDAGSNRRRRRRRRRR